jgi:hypothetical protein
VVFSCREPPLLTVYSSAGRGEDNLAHPILDASLEEADCSQDVHVGIEVRLPNRASDIHLGCLVAQCLRPKVLEDLGTPGADISLVKVCAPSGMFSRLPLERSSTMASSWWRPRSASATWEPINPAPPLSKTLIARLSVQLR